MNNAAALYVVLGGLAAFSIGNFIFFSIQEKLGMAISDDSLLEYVKYLICSVSINISGNIISRKIPGCILSIKSYYALCLLFSIVLAIFYVDNAYSLIVNVVGYFFMCSVYAKVLRLRPYR